MTALAIHGCRRRHTAKDSGRWILGDEQLMRLIAANEVAQVIARCAECGSETGPLPYADVPVDPSALPVLRDNRFRYRQQPCQVKGCGSEYTELHHFAPRAVFGRFEADNWPQGYLCRIHHQEWHRRMGGAH